MDNLQRIAPPAKNLIQKAAMVMAAVKHVPKNGFNSFHNYKYATEADITECVRENMAEQGIMLVPSVEKVEWTPIATSKGTDRLCTLTVKFTLTDGAETMDFIILGEGQDRGDKATYKAMTGAEKYALMKLFMIPTGDDPEKEEEERAPRPQQRPAPAKQPPLRPISVEPTPEQKAGAVALVQASMEQSVATGQEMTFKHKDVYAELKKNRTAAQMTALVQKAIGRTPPLFSELTQEDLAAVADEILATTIDIPF